MMRLVLFFCQLQVSIVFRCSRNRVLPIVQCMRAVVQVAMKMRCGARLANSEGSWRLDFGNSGHLTYFSISGALLQRQRLRLREIRQQGVCLQCNCGIASHRGFATVLILGSHLLDSQVGNQVIKCSWGKEGGGARDDSQYGGGGGGYNSNQVRLRPLFMTS